MTRFGWWGFVLVSGACAMGGDGAVQVGKGLSFASSACEQTLDLPVSNAEPRERKLLSIRRLAGAPVRAVPFLDEPLAVFELIPMTKLAPSEQTVIPVVFRPRGTGAVEATVELDFDGQKSTVTLSVNAMAPTAAPRRIDFAAVPVGSVSERPIGVTPPFQLSIAGGPFRLSADRSRIIFTPERVQEYVTQATLIEEPCGVRPFNLVGTGVEGFLVSDPPALTFEPTPPGLERSARLELRNASLSPLAVERLLFRPGGMPAFRADALDGGQLVIPAASRDATGLLVRGRAAVSVVFAPAREGPVADALIFDVPLLSGMTPFVPLSGVGGGPDIEVAPTSLVLQTGSTGARARLTIRNVGTVSTNPALHLRLGAPAFEFTRQSGAGDVAVDFASPSQAGQSLASGDSVELEVTATPGAGEHHVRIFSNDLDEPVVTVVVTTR